MQNAKCNSAKYKIWFCVGVRHILREVWLFALAYPAHLLSTVVFVMFTLLYELSNEEISIFVHRGRRIPTFDLVNSTRSPECCRFMVRNVGKYRTFPGGYLSTHYEFILVCGYFEWKWRIFNNYSTRACWISNDRLLSRRIAPGWL